MKRKNTLPLVPSREDVLMLLSVIKNIKHKAILVLLYSSGLRLSEVASLRIGDICSKSMRIRVEKAKHDTFRYTILSDTALDILRSYFKAYFSNKPYTKNDWLFQGQKDVNHISPRTI
ncbi:tyrosine-type recombinase/integrase, partial [Pseudomonas sp. 2995-1]|uniref:tyrosine-type recombinase/integrase n=1 Tax=Pseudomonas sp. 2995-1 TaxID=1712679 RepID=UPI002114DA3E